MQGLPLASRPTANEAFQPEQGAYWSGPVAAASWPAALGLAASLLLLLLLCAAGPLARRCSRRRAHGPRCAAGRSGTSRAALDLLAYLLLLGTVAGATCGLAQGWRPETVPQGVETVQGVKVSERQHCKPHQGLRPSSLAIGGLEASLVRLRYVLPSELNPDYLRPHCRLSSPECWPRGMPPWPGLLSWTAHLLRSRG